MDEYYRAVGALPPWLAAPLGEVPIELAERVHEVRLRLGGAPGLTIDGRQYAAAGLAQCPQELKRLVLDEARMEEIFYTLCGNSVHSHGAELAAGYVTTAIGCRVGVAGLYAELPQQGVVLQRVRSLNLRIARQKRITLPEKLTHALEGRFTGLLIAGEPGSGKTTLLREVARSLASRGRAVTAVDERRELFPDNIELCGALDVLSGLPKARAVQMALRTLSPRVILFDELGGMDEAAALEQGFFSGVDFVASIHASSLDEALRRPQVKFLKERAMLRAVALLEGSRRPGQVKEVYFV